MGQILGIRADKPPTHLTPEAKRLWRQVNNEYELESNHLIVLKTALEAFDRLTEARVTIAAEGSTYETESGYIRPHPSLQIEKEARSGFLQAWRMLGFDMEPPRPVGPFAHRRAGWQ